MKLLFTSISFLFALFSIGQSIDKPPIYKGFQSLTIDELGFGGVYWGYQNPDYDHIIDIVSFTTSTKDESVNLMNECIRILEMPKTGKDEHIRHEAEGVSIVRYSFAQKKVYLHDGLQLTKKMCQQIIQNLEAYSFSTWEAAFNVGDTVLYNRIGQTYEAVIMRVTEGSDYYSIKYSPLEGYDENKTVNVKDLKRKD